MSDQFAGVSEELGIELEALEATYGDELSIQQNQQHLQISIQLQPQDAEQCRHFVQCSLLLSCHVDDYPASQPPSIQLQDVKGFAARQEQLLQTLSADAAELAGELLLGHLIEAATSWLTDHNCPEGECFNVAHSRQQT